MILLTTTPVVAASPVIGFDNSKPKQILDKFNSIEIDLNSNNKYKGFRRSVDVAKAPIHVPIHNHLHSKRLILICLQV